MVCRVTYDATRWIETGGGTNVVDLGAVLTFGITIPYGGDQGASDFSSEYVEGCCVLTRDITRALECR